MTLKMQKIAQNSEKTTKICIFRPIFAKNDEKMAISGDLSEGGL